MSLVNFLKEIAEVSSFLKNLRINDIVTIPSPIKQNKVNANFAGVYMPPIVVVDKSNLASRPEMLLSSVEINNKKVNYSKYPE